MRVKAICSAGPRNWSRNASRRCVRSASRSAREAASGKGEDRSRPTTSAANSGCSGLVLRVMARTSNDKQREQRGVVLVGGGGGMNGLQPCASDAGERGGDRDERLPCDPGGR